MTPALMRARIASPTASPLDYDRHYFDGLFLAEYTTTAPAYGQSPGPTPKIFPLID